MTTVHVLVSLHGMPLMPSPHLIFLSNNSCRNMPVSSGPKSSRGVCCPRRSPSGHRWPRRAPLWLRMAVLEMLKNGTLNCVPHNLVCVHFTFFSLLTAFEFVAVVELVLRVTETRVGGFCLFKLHIARQILSMFGINYGWRGG